LRTFTAETRLDDLNFGLGVDNYDGVDFTIQRTDGTALDVDLTTEQTIGDVLTLINTLGGGSLRAQLARYGNGIELIDQSTGPQPLTVTRAPESTAAIDLGLVPQGQETSDPPTAGALATALWDDASSADNELRITANVESWDYNGVTLNVHDDGAAVGNVPILSYDPVNRVLDIEIQNGVTTANDVVTELGNTPAVAALLTLANDGASSGAGTLTDADPAWGSVLLSGGQPETLTGADVNPLETEGLFTALLRLQQGLEANDLRTLQRAMEMLDAYGLRLNAARADVGARQQGLDTLQSRLETEEVQLREVLSLEHDADVVEVASNLSARQLALEAALLSTGKIFQMNLLQYI
jgi:flagellin-like hook-associated protein FlgL